MNSCSDTLFRLSKSSLGSEEWKRFFSLMGSVVAFREKSPLVPNTHANRRDLISELRDISHRLNVEHRLSEYNKALQSIANPAENAFYYLLKLDPDSRTLTITGYDNKESEEANRAYAEAEQATKQRPGMDAVLVSVESVSSLAKAYPNYFADTRVFLDLMKQALEGRSRGIHVSDLKIGTA